MSETDLSDKLTRLIERVEEAIGPDATLDAEIFAALRVAEYRREELGSGAEVYSGPNVTQSVDAALALVELVLPKLVVVVARLSNGDFQIREAWIDDDADEIIEIYTQRPCAPARAIVAALLRARVAQEPVS